MCTCVFGGVWCGGCGGCGWGGIGGRGEGGNSEWVCRRASLMGLGAYSYVVQNPSGLTIAKVALIWICGSVVHV